MNAKRIAQKIRERLAGFGRDRRGNVVIIFGLLLGPVMMVSYAGVQYTLTAGIRTKLNAIADAAALQAVSSVAAANYVSTGQTDATNAKAMFNAQAALISGVTINTLSVTVTPTGSTTTSPGSLTAKVVYTASTTSVMPSLLGTYFQTLSGSSTASASLPTYTNFYLLLDDSPSMGIGATPADITAMQNANNGCGFACHSPHATDGTYPGYTLPNVPGTSLRIDAMRNAVATLISTAISSQTVTSQYKIGLYTFANTVTAVSALSTNLTQVQSDNNGIQLPTTDIGTQIGDAVAWLSNNAVVGSTAGNGTKTSPYQFVFLVTDGVEDHAFNFTSGGGYDTLVSPYGTWNGTNYSSVMQSSACTLLKNKGVTVAVLYTNYDPLTDVRYVDMVQPFAGNIVSSLQSCASPNFFFQADSASDISSAMQQMFAAALQQAAYLSK